MHAPRPGNFSSERDAPEMLKACDVLSLTTEVVAEEERPEWCKKVNVLLPEDIRIFGRSGPLPGDFDALRPRDSHILRNRSSKYVMT